MPEMNHPATLPASSSAIDQLETGIAARMEAMEQRMIAFIHDELTSQTRTLVLLIVGAHLTLAGITVAAAIAL
jgi:hypothetical protein